MRDIYAKTIDWVARTSEALCAGIQTFFSPYILLLLKVNWYVVYGGYIVSVLRVDGLYFEIWPQIFMVFVAHVVVRKIDVINNVQLFSAIY